MNQTLPYNTLNRQKINKTDNALYSCDARQGSFSKWGWLINAREMVGTILSNTREMLRAILWNPKAMPRNAKALLSIVEHCWG